MSSERKAEAQAAQKLDAALSLFLKKHQEESGGQIFYLSAWEKGTFEIRIKE